MAVRVTMGKAYNGSSIEVPSSRAADDVPLSFAVTMDSLAAWIDHVDKILVRRGEKASLSDGQVQRDLRRIAAACRADPTLDDLMMDAMLHGAGEPDSGTTDTLALVLSWLKENS